MSAAAAAAARGPAAPRLALNRQFLAGYGVVAIFTLTVSLLILLRAGAVLNFGFPLATAILAGVLFATRRGVYVAFVWWIWLFAPEVRRFVDYQTSFHAFSPVMLTPLAVTLYAAYPILRGPRVVLSRFLLPFSLAGLALVYGLALGAPQNGLAPALYDFAQWMAPLIFGVFLLLDDKHFAENRAAILGAMTIGLLGTALYGLYQFYYLPPWDKYWLDQTNIASTGTRAAEQIRLFGPLNSPGPYGIALMGPLIFAQITKGPLKIAASVAGYPAFGLSLVRSAWGGWAVGTLVLLARAKGGLKLRILTTAAIVMVLVTPLVTIGPAADILSKRFASFGNIQQDGSFQARRSLYENFSATALAQPIGLGLGYNGNSTRLSDQLVAGFDSALLEIPYEFGWVAGALLIWSAGTLALLVLRSSAGRRDNVANAAAGVYIAMVLQSLAAPSFTGIMGMTLWSAAAIAYAPCLLP